MIINPGLEWGTLFPDKAIWNPPIHMRLLHHGVELTLKGQSSWAPNSAWSRAFFHPKHLGESWEQRVLNGFETGADHHFMASGFGVYMGIQYTPFGVKLLNSNGILDQTKSFNRFSSNIEVRVNGATRPVLVLKSTSRSSLFPFVKLGCITSGWHHLTSKYSMSISKCQVQHDEGPKVSAKPGRSFPGLQQLTATHKTGAKASCPAVQKRLGNLKTFWATSFLKKERHMQKSVAFLFPESIHQSPSIVLRMPRSPDSQHLQVTQPIRRSPARGCVRHQREAEVSSPPLKPPESHGKPAGDDMGNWKIGL